MNHVAFIWNIAESLRGPFKRSEHGSVVLPFTVLRRLDAVLANTKPGVLEAAKAIESLPEMLQAIKLKDASGHQFYKTSPFDFGKLARSTRTTAPRSRRSSTGSTNASATVRRRRIDLQMNHIVGKLALDLKLANRAGREQPTAVCRVIRVAEGVHEGPARSKGRDPAFIDDLFNDSGLYAELGRRCWRNSYGFFKEQADPRG